MLPMGIYFNCVYELLMQFILFLTQADDPVISISRVICPCFNMQTDPGSLIDISYFFCLHVSFVRVIGSFDLIEVTT
jgi:hypothetical protein